MTRQLTSAKKRIPLVFILALFMVSCNKRSDYVITQKQIDTTDSLVTVQANYIEITSASKKVNQWLDSINTAVYTNIMAQKDTIAKYSAEDRKQFKESWPPYELMVGDTVYLSNKNIVSVLYTIYTFTGGAHGMTQFVGYNYDMVQMKELTAKEIFKPEATAEINKLLAEYFKDPDNCFMSKPTLEQVSAVNLAFESVIFTYEQYILGAYACGPATVTVPIEPLKKYLTRELNLGI